MTEVSESVSQLKTLLSDSDLNARRTELVSVVAQLGESLESHDKSIRNLLSRVDQLEIHMTYLNPHRGC